MDEDFDLVYCLIDLDAIITNNTIMKFIVECKSLPQTIIPIASNPCTEIWFLMHYRSVATNESFERCDDVGQLLKKENLPYSKGNKGKKSDRMFELMEQEGSFENACENAITNIARVKINTQFHNSTFTEIVSVLNQLEVCSQCDFSTKCCDCVRRPQSIIQKIQEIL